MTWDPETSRGNESEKVLWDIVPYTRGKGLDIGCGPWKAYDHFIGFDKEGADETGDARDLSRYEDGAMDFVYSSHCLEDLEDTADVLREWWRVVKVGGHLVLYLPHADFYPHVGTPGANAAHVHDFLPQDIIDLMSGIGHWDLVRNEDRNEGNEYSFLLVFQKRPDGEFGSFSHLIRHGKTACVVRYGGIGDMIQAASVLPQLKLQGFRVVVMTTPNGQVLLQHDPHIDEFVLQDSDQVPNARLHEFWAHQAKHYDRFINLSESVEGTWLAMAGRNAHAWPHAVRGKYLNRNYLEFIHDLAQVPYAFAPKFYATEPEKQWARMIRSKMLGRVVCWSLSGSSLHKAWPYADEVIGQLVSDGSYVVLMGDTVCQMLEEPWEGETHVIRTCGRWPVRSSLAFLEQADLVIGPETGLLNAAGMLDMPKIVMLSHSSEENLTKHWRNTIALKADVHCHPCHRLHFTWEHCWEHKETGAAMCQADISVDEVLAALTLSRALEAA